MYPFSGLILGGGRGARFGGPKAFAALPDGRSCLEACAESLREAGADPIMATLPRGVSGLAPDHLHTCTVDPDLDMFSSLRLGLEQLAESSLWQRVIILPVDHPLIEAKTLRALASTSHSAAIPTYRGHHGHPITLGRGIAEKILDGRLPGPTLREILKAARAVDIEVDDPQTRANCNTPQALAEAWQLKTGRRNPA